MAQPALRASSVTALPGTGIGPHHRQRIAQALRGCLADAHLLYLQTHQHHWNVTGPMFHSLHTLFEQQYNEQWLALDEIAERIRALGVPAPGTYRELLQLASRPEPPQARNEPAWQERVEQLLEGHQALCATLRKALETADEGGDDASVDLTTRRLQAHEKHAWMLRSLLG